MLTRTERNGVIDFLKFLFCISLCLGHWGRGCSYAYLVTEFFFIVSGFLMCVSVEKEKNNIFEGCYAFIKKKIVGLAPEFILVFFLIRIYLYSVNSYSLNTIIYLSLNSIWELGFATMFHLGLSTYILGVTWYISAMLICMVILYPLIRLNSHWFYNIFTPFMFLLIYGFMSYKVGNLYIVYSDDGNTYYALLRAMGAMLGGCIAYNIACKLKSFKYSYIGKMIFCFIEPILWVGGVYTAYKWAMTETDFVIVLLLVLAISFSFSEISVLNKIFNRKMFNWLGKLSYCIYLVHIYVPNIFCDFIKVSVSEVNTIILVLITCIVAMIIMYLSLIFSKCYVNIKERIRNIVLEKEEI